MSEAASTSTIHTESFKAFLLSNHWNELALWTAAVAAIVQFLTFKYFYPFANYIYYDSIYYLIVASENLDVNTHMVGYARFLRLFSVFSTSDIALVGFQYFMVQINALFLVFTTFYFYRPGKWIRNVLLCFIILNPLFLYLANLVSSDAFFLALSLAWISLLLWILHKPGSRVIIWHAIVLFIAFTVRYNALIYPVISACVFMVSKQPIRRKIVSISCSIILCGFFVLYTGNKFRDLTGVWQYSPFSGWLLANNAMYAYRYVDSNDRKTIPQRFAVLDSMMRDFYDHYCEPDRNPADSQTGGAFYMWGVGSPLRVYMRRFIEDTINSRNRLKEWAKAGLLYKEYGAYIIRQYPGYYARHFLWPNSVKYLTPSVEFLRIYNQGRESVDPIVQSWFKYKNKNVFTRTKHLRVGILDFYPILFGVLNFMMAVSLLCFAMLDGFKMKTLFRKGITLVGSIWLLNAVFTIFASSAALRFQTFPIVVTASFTMLMLDWFLKLNNVKGKNNRSNTVGEK